MPTTILSSTDHRHLIRDELQQALALVGIVVKIINGRVPHNVEASLHDIGLFLQRYGQAGNRLPKQRFHDVRENLIAIGDQAERAVRFPAALKERGVAARQTQQAKRTLRTLGLRYSYPEEMVPRVYPQQSREKVTTRRVLRRR